MSLRKDLYKIDIDTDISLLVFHKDIISVGFGPAISLYINDVEFFKFDCFGPEKGHYHILDGDRIFFSEKSVIDQIARSITDLNDIIKKYYIDTELLTNKLSEAQRKMVEYETTYYEKSRR